MKKKPSRLGLIVPVKAEEKPKQEKKEVIEYHDVLEPKEMQLLDGIKLVFSVSTTPEGNPHLDIRTYIDTPKYKGPTKKGINFDLENMEEFKAIIEEIDLELQKKNL